MSLPRLNAATLAQVSGATIPAYPRNGEPGVLHLGLGAFTRAHQAMVFDRLLAQGDARWGMHGVGMTQPRLVQQLREQNGLYALRVADAQGLRWHVPGALWRLNVATTEREAVLQAMAGGALRWITLTVTEKGYSPELGSLLAQGLRLRQAQGGAGLTMASCDNLQGNGDKLRALVLAACEESSLRDWVDSACAFPCSMVDRIVPASSELMRGEAEAALGLHDETALGTEGFWEWVLEDRLADPSDAAVLAAAGVKITGQVHVYEEAKLRMLNGSHSAMALMGAITGRRFIADCIGAPHIQAFVRRLMEREVAPHLARQDWPAYRDALIQRFGNPHLRHSVHQIATDSSLKIPQRWPPSVLGQLQTGAGIDHHALAAAAWLRYGLGRDEQGQPYEIQDPNAERLRQLAAEQRHAPEAAVQALLAQADWWGDQLPRLALWQQRVRHWHSLILARGMDGAVQQLLQDIP
ncbi:MAG: mannitol dehydrogenase family protein [Betaproteobacteria bacterium]